MMTESRSEIAGIEAKPSYDNRSIIGHFDGVVGSVARGWAINAVDPQTPVRVQIISMSCGDVIVEGLASIPRPDLKNIGIESTVGGFALQLPLGFWEATPATVVAISESGQALDGGAHQVLPIDRCQFHIDGFSSRNTITGWIKDGLAPERLLTVELIEEGRQLTFSKNDLPHEMGGCGRFNLILPDSILDERIHTFTFVCPELELELGVEHFLTPSLTPPAEDLRYPFLDDSIWDNTPAALAARKARQAKPQKTELEIQIEVMETALEKAGSEEPDLRYELTCQIGKLLKKNNQLNLSLEHFDKAIAMDGGNPLAYCAYADALLSSGMETDAEAYLLDALQRLPEAPQLLTRLDKLRAARRPKTNQVIAFYLPQFHPTPENDLWWGKGFTEWSNVTSAASLFHGHLQPRRPTALGYYDLRLPEAANAQFELARKYGINAFCYYYYWFDGKRVLERPLQDLVDGKTGPFPFCICWANEDWTRSWDGMSGEVLLAQNHTPESDFRFIQDVAPLLTHPDYVRNDGKPVLLIYRANKLATPKETVQAWRDWCIREGIGELHVCAVQSFGFDDPRPMGFDAAVEFPPHSLHENYPEHNYYQKLSDLPGLVERFSGSVFNYEAIANAFMKRPREAYRLHRGCFLAWDNTARRGKTAHIYHNFSVSKYRQWLAHNAIRCAQESDSGMVFVNAWNEWAEGTMLEPDTYFGHELLEATCQAKTMLPLIAQSAYWKHDYPILHYERIEASERIILVGHDAHPHGAQINMLNMARCMKRDLGMDLLILLMEGGALVQEYERVSTTIVLGQQEGWQSNLDGVLRQYSALGTRKAICNTVVTGEIGHALHCHDYKVVSLVHELPSLIESHNLQVACWHVASNADNIVFASDVVAREFRYRYWPDPEKILIAPQGIAFNPYHAKRDLLRQEIREELDLPRNIRLIMGCGYGDTRKGIDLFVQMAGEVSKLIDEVAFIWVGGLDGGIAPYILSDIKRLNLSSLLHITGRVENTARYYIAADAFALTSREDPFPSVVMEAFDAGLPVVAFEGGGGYVEIVNDQTGALVPYLDVSAMSGALADLLRHDKRRQRISEHVHKYCRDTFGYPDYMRKLLALLDGVPAKAVAQGHLKRCAWYEDSPRPTITAIVPNYNYGRYLELRLRTILDQTLPPDEIIVLDDASTDYSLDIVRAIAEKSAIPIHVITNASNTGNPFVQWAKGLERAKSELVWIAEADDYSEPTLLETLAKEFVDESVVLAWCDSIIVDDVGGSQGFEYKNYYAKEYGAFWYTHFKMGGKELIDRCLLVANVVPNASAVLFRRRTVGADLSRIQQYRFSGDWWFWISIAQQGTVAYRADALNYHRRHSQSVMGDVLREGEKLIPETMAFYMRLAQYKPETLSPKARIEIFQRLEGIYRLFPKLSAQAPRLKDHPAFKDTYQALIDLLNPVNALKTCRKRALATLVLSEDVVGDVLAISRLIQYLLDKHDLQVAILGNRDAADALIKTVDLDDEVVHILPFKVKDGMIGNTEGKQKVNDRPSVEQTKGLADLLTKASHVISHGLQAHVMTQQLWSDEQGEWTLIAGNDFNALLGVEPDNKIVSLEGLAGAIERCTRAFFITDALPHVFGRLALASLRPVDRLDLNMVTIKPRKNQNNQGNQLIQIAIAASTTLDHWVGVIRRLEEKRQMEKIDARLRLLVMGPEVSSLKPLVEGNEFVEMVWVYEKPAIQLSGMERVEERTNG